MKQQEFENYDALNGALQNYYSNFINNYKDNKNTYVRDVQSQLTDYLSQVAQAKAGAYQ